MIDESTGYVFAGVIGFCIFLSCLARSTAKQKRRWRSTLSTLLTDYTFDSYATLSAASFIYAVCQGAAIGFILCSVYYSFKSGQPIWLLYSLASFLGLLILRIAIEAYVAFYKVAQDASNFFSTCSGRGRARSQSTAQEGNFAADEGRPRIASLKKKPAAYYRESWERIVYLLRADGVDVSSASYERSFIGDTMATIMSKDGDVLAEIEIDRSSGRYYMRFDSGEKVDLSES